ncbi:AEC family transporter [Desulfovibrio mangrovi]|uniref:AEC family transporter n=1 Tax=Desulfovibrio mangrovi TaxID=2976983 RepID=UPI00224661A7|nr:AEC family transporter [Desulfovibrio mangrovi]UZP69103.1 AEC family transporter [Desulfovibrio mangrovi]
MNVLAAIAPIFALIVTGFFLKRISFPSEGFWPQAERLTYYVLFPALLLDKLANIHLGDQPVWSMALAMGLGVCIMAGGLLILRSRVQTDGPAFTSIFQGAMRPNTYVGLSAASGLFGDAGVSLSAVALMTLIPLVNVLCVTTLVRHGRNGQNGHTSAKPEKQAGGLLFTLRQLATNPLILGCIAGFALNGLELQLPSSIGEALRILGSASLPMGLLSVGAGLSFAALVKGSRDVLVSSACKLLILPAITGILCLLLGISGTALAICLIFTAIPVSVSSYILARVLGGDHERMAAIITAQTLLSALTMPVVLMLVI